MKPSRDHVKKALSLVQSAKDYEFLFKNIKSPDWLEPLIEEGIFDKTAEINEYDDTVEIPDWAPSKYLLKIAEKKSEQVLDILSNLSDTKNPKIISDFLDTAIKLPTHLSVTLVDAYVEWLGSEYVLFFSEKLATLSAKYFEGEFAFQGFKLSESLLTILYVRDADNNTVLKTPYIRGPWEYNRCIDIIRSSITSTTSLFILFDLLANKLTVILMNEKRIEKNENHYSDGSYIWRMDVEENNHSIDNLEDILINWLRDIGSDLIKADSAQLDILLSKLIKMQWPIFIRLGLYFIRKNNHRADLATKCLLNNSFANSRDIWHEYVLLLRDVFPVLENQKKVEILKFNKNLEPPTLKNEYRFYSILYLVKDSLPSEYKADFEQLHDKYGKLDHPEYLFYFSGVTEVKPISAITLQELHEKDFDEIASFLSSWRPPEDERYGEYTYGLSQTIETDVSERSNEYSNNIQKFKLSNCTIVRAIIQGFNNALSSENKFLWDNALEYLSWAVTQSVNAITYKNDADKEMKWSGVKEAACKLIQKGMTSDNNPISLKQRELAWSIIQASLKDSDPDENREAGISIDFHHIAINSTRGIALETAINYGLWVAKTLNLKRYEDGSKEIGELFITLESHLDTEHEKSKAVRSVYGVLLPYLLVLDKEWTRKNVDKIFPPNESEKLLRYAALESYLKYTTPYGEVYNEIQGVYFNAIQHMNSEPLNNEILKSRLADHIVIFYLSGVVTIGSPILNTLYEHSDKNIRSHVIDLIGRLVNDSNAENAMAFWEWRSKVCGKNHDWGELIEFGWWMNSSLPGGWILDQAALVLEKTSTIAPSHMVVETLSDLCLEFPEKVLKVFKLIVDKKVREHGFYLWRSAAEELIPFLLKTEYHDETLQLVEKLGAYGMDEFRNFTK